MKKNLLFFFSLLAIAGFAQKKPLDHSVYDGWQSITERAITSDGKYVTYTINPQEGDGVLYIKATDGNYTKEIARGYGAVITDDGRYVICRIKPAFKDTRDARIKKKRPDEMPKDSLAMVELGKDNITKVPRVKSFKVPDDSGNWLAYLLEKPLPEPARRPDMDSSARVRAMLTMADSLTRAADSIRNKANEVKLNGLSVLRGNRPNNGATRAPEEPFEEGTVLVLRNLVTGEEKRFPLVSEFFFNTKGTTLLIETTRKTGDAQSQAAVTRVDLASGNSAVVFKKFNDAKGYRMDEDGKQFAFVAERDSSSKSLQKFYKLYYHKAGMDSAVLLADRNTQGLAAKWTVSENASISFSKTGQRLFVGTAPILPVKDTTLPDFERVSVDVWHYNDDDVQPMQLKNLDNDLRRSYAARVDMDGKKLVQLIDDKFRNMIQTKDGDGDFFYAVSDFGKRLPAQWQGYALRDIYLINPVTGVSEIITRNFKGNIISASHSGKYLLYFDEKKSGYFVYNAVSRKIVPIAKDIPFSLSDEENDVPDEPNAYGIAQWVEDDKYVLMYDRYDIWRVDPAGAEKSVCLTQGRTEKIRYRLVNTNPDDKFIKADQKLVFRVFDKKDKSSGLAIMDPAKNNQVSIFLKEPISFGDGSSIQKAKNADVLVYTKESFQKSTDIYVHPLGGAGVQLSHTNPQQSDFNWGTAELFKWKAYTGKEAEGIIYKPENFDPGKKYPMIVYFYERNSDTIHHYFPPAPTRSNLNIPFFVSRGYIVFIPDIWYKIGYPGKSSYDYILSGTRAVIQKGYVDSTKVGLQGQSWGGYAIAYLITKTNLYAAAWAGAPVVNMFSAYGGIRWESGMNRQFQYEKTQSRIGATLWEKPELYRENSPLFSLPAVKTPLVIMNNDADGAVPWYQGIEYYTAMRRLNKKIWFLNYNGEGHGLVERKNKKDISIREQQFFDYLLKGEKPAKWIAEGVPAVLKGRDLGLGK